MPAQKRNLKPQTPGNKIEEDKLPPQEGSSEESVSIIEEKTYFEEPERGDESDQEITLKKSDLEALVAEMVEKQVEDRVVSEVKAARRRSELSKSNTQGQDLPDQKDVDIAKIKRAVLTKQGWVCPLVHPSDMLRMERSQNIPS